VIFQPSQPLRVSPLDSFFISLDPNVTVHSLHVTALTTAWERGSDIIDLQDFAGHAGPRTTLTYIRARDRLSKSSDYVLKY
jgi:integrase/recombinase XerD